jgi:hypothetical protein
MQVEGNKTPYEQYVFFVNRFIETGEPVEHKIIDDLREPALNYVALIKSEKEERLVGLMRTLVDISDAIGLTKKNFTEQDAILVQGLSQLNQLVQEAGSSFSRTQKELITLIDENIANIDTLQIKRKALLDVYNKEMERLSVGLVKLLSSYKQTKSEAEINDIEFRAAIEMLDTVQSRRLEAGLKFVEDISEENGDEMQMNELPVIEIDERITDFYLQEYSGNPTPLSVHENHYTYVVTSKGVPLLLSLNMIDTKRKEKRLEKNLMRHLMLSSSIKEFAKYHGSFTLNTTTKKMRDFFANIRPGDTGLPVSVHTTEYYTMTGEELFEKEQISEEDKLSLLLQLLLALYEAKSQFNLEYNRVNSDYLRYIKLDQPVVEERHTKSKIPLKIKGAYRVKLLHHDHLKKRSTEEGATVYLEHDDYTGFFSVVKSFQLSEKKQSVFLKAQKSKGRDAFKNLFTLFAAKQ